MCVVLSRLSVHALLGDALPALCVLTPLGARELLPSSESSEPALAFCNASAAVLLGFDEAAVCGVLVSSGIAGYALMSCGVC